MPVKRPHPGVYIEEVPNGARTIVGVATSITAFIGSATRGPTNEPIPIANFGDFKRNFGDIAVNHMLGNAVSQFFLNGGTDAIIVRVANAATAAKATIDAGGLWLLASGEGLWGNSLRVLVDSNTDTPSDDVLFNIRIREIVTDEDGNEKIVSEEIFRNVAVNEDHPRYARTVIDEESGLVDVHSAEAAVPDAPPGDGTYNSSGDGMDGNTIEDADVVGSPVTKTGIHALEKTDLFNILCIPPLTRGVDIAYQTFGKAANYCVDRRTMLLVDPPTDAVTVEEGERVVRDMRAAIGTANSKNAALFIPRLRMPDVNRQNQLAEFVPCGAVAGVMARTDLQRGVWTSSAGIEASLVGVNEFNFKINDRENGQLNTLGVNCLRNFPGIGNVVWGSRTLDGADQLGSEWKYLAVRRLALFIEETLYRGTQWVVFEPNDEPLWAKIRLNVGAFMQNLFRQAAFQGSSPPEAYFVRCGSDTTTQADINLGIINIEVGFAPLKPAEFVIIKIQQMAGNGES